MSSPPDHPELPPEPPAYTSDNIQIFRGLEHVRRRPGMYIGSVNERGVRNVVEGLVCQAVEEALAGLCDRLTIELLPDGGYRLSGNGPGTFLPLADNHFLISEVYCPGRSSPAPYPVNLFGMDVTLVANAVSDPFVAEVIRDGRRWRQEFRRGEPVAAAEAFPDKGPPGTRITFWLDPQIFPERQALDFAALAERIQQICWLFPTLKIDLIDRRSRRLRKKECRGGTGLVDYVQCLNRKRQPVLSPVFFCSGKAERQECEVAMQWTGESEEQVLSFANFLHMPLGGTPVTGIRQAATRALNRHAGFFGPAEHRSLTGEDWRTGLTAVVSVKHAEPHLEGAIRARMNNPEAEGFVRTTVEQPLALFLESHPDAAQAIGQHALQAYRQRMSQKQASNRRRRSDQSS